MPETPAAPFAAIAVELKAQATELARIAELDEATAHEILTPTLAAHIIAQRKMAAQLIGDAHRVIKALIPVENTVRAIIKETGERI